MNRCEVGFEQENLISLLSGPEFYGKPEAYLKELLKNAVDACMTRKALEWSFGTEFLEMEEAQALNSMREPYQPAITISFSSISQRLTIEDNGIGMNGHDIEQYVAKVGNSYYTSEEFWQQQLDYEPLSRRGIGLLSAFAVSRGILIESRKDKSVNTAWNVMNRASLEPITAKWMENAGSIEYITSGKEESGSRVTLVLKPRYALKLTFGQMVHEVQRAMLYQPFPIKIQYDNRETVLAGENQILDDPYADILGVVSICVLDELVEGYVWIYGDRQAELLGKPRLYQQGFLVEEGDTLLDLKPEWIKNMSCQLHVKNPNLQTRACGEGAVRDENFGRLRELVGSRIVETFAGNPLGVSVYLVDGNQPAITEYETEMQFLQKAVTVQVFLKERLLELPVETILHGFEGKIIRIAFMEKELFSFYRDMYPGDFRRFLKENKLVVFEKNKDLFTQLLTPYMRSMRYVVSEYPGIVYRDVVADFGHLRSVVPFRNAVSQQPEKIGYEDIFCVAGKTKEGRLNLQVNEDHAIVRRLAPVWNEPRVHRMMAVILENIKQRILNPQQKWDCILDFGGLLVDEWPKEKNLQEQTVGCLEKDFVESTNEYILTCLSPQELEELGLKGLAFHREDFISWWFAPRE